MARIGTSGLGGGSAVVGNIDGGDPYSIYAPGQNVNGGDPETVAQQIQFRNGTSAMWIAANPTLAQGEMGLEDDTGQFKVGDGVTPWNDLEYGGLDAQPIVDTGGYATPTLITSTIAIPVDIRARLYVKGNGGPVVATLGNGSGTQEFYIFGTNNTNTVEIDSAANVFLSGPMVLRDKCQLVLNWISDLTAWVEASRNEL